MIRVLSYNILLGGTQREQQLVAILQAAHPDVIGLVEATNPLVVEKLAQRLGMQFRLTARSRNMREYNLAILSRLPITYTRVHTHPGIFTRRHLLEVGIEEPGGQRLTIFVAHLTSNFYRGMYSVRKRRREVQGILQIMACHQGTPHLVMGDFNSIAPGEDFQGSALLRFFRGKRKARPAHPKPQDGKKFINYWLKRVLNLGISNPLLIPLTDRLTRIYIQGGIDLLQEAGYIDCYRTLHPTEDGFTFHTAMPVGRIDYIFASAELAKHLSTCNVILEGNDVDSKEASDHRPIYASFI
jgi:endonuclease/exonuclease/phosphatase family metal-dependent hydrolase